MILPSATTAFEYEIVSEQFCKINPRQVYLEIGSNKGNSLKAFSSLMEDKSTMIAIDYPNSVWGTLGSEILLKSVQSELISKGYDVHLILGDSRKLETIDELKKILNKRKVDVLFIDADHTFYGVASDIHNYSTFVRSGGIIIFHDCGKIKAAGGGESGYSTIHGVHCAFDAFSYGKKWMLIQEQWGIGIIWI